MATFGGMDRVAGVAIGLVCASTAANADRSTRDKIADAVASAPAHRLTKSELRPSLKKIFPKLTSCYQRELARAPGITGVVNTALEVLNDPELGMSLTVTGFDTDGPLGDSKTFRACVTSVFEGTVYPAIGTRGRLDFLYPGTFGTAPVDDHQRPLVDRADQANRDGHYEDALALATRGLKDVTMNGELRHRLVGAAGVAACHAKIEAQARHFWALASPEFEPAIATSCQDAAIDLSK